MARERSTQRAPSPAPGSRVLPHNLEAEEALLGAALLSRDAVRVVATQVTPEDFYRPAHGHIAAVIRKAFGDGWPVDALTVAAELDRQGLLTDIGGTSKLVEIQDRVPALSSAPRYARIVHDHATLRRLHHVAGNIADLSTGTQGLPEDVHDAVVRAHALLTDVAKQNGARTFSNLHAPDMRLLVAGDLELPQPDFLTRTDGQALLYAGRINGFQGEPGTAKTWLALTAVHEVLDMGGASAYLDYEDTDRGITSRLLGLGADPTAVAERFQYLAQQGPMGPAERAELVDVLDRINPDLIVIDGVAEALVREGYDEDRNSEVARWIENLPRWLARTGAAVLLLDHLKKPEKGVKQRYARGAGHKLAAVDGIVYGCRLLEPFSRRRAGKIALVVDKDRNGAVGSQGDTIAHAKVEPAADGEVMRITIDPAPSDEERAKPTRTMKAVSGELERMTAPIPATHVTKLLMHIQPKYVRAAIVRLLTEGWVRQTSKGITSVEPYDEDSIPPALRQPRLELDRLPVGASNFELDTALWAEDEGERDGGETS